MNNEQNFEKVKMHQVSLQDRIDEAIKKATANCVTKEELEGTVDQLKTAVRENAVSKQELQESINEVKTAVVDSIDSCITLHTAPLKVAMTNLQQTPAQAMLRSSRKTTSYSDTMFLLLSIGTFLWRPRFRDGHSRNFPF